MNRLKPMSTLAAAMAAVAVVASVFERGEPMVYALAAIAFAVLSLHDRS